MTTLTGLLCALAVVAVVGAGLATIAGAHALRARLLVLAVFLVVVVLAMPVLAAALQAIFSASSGPEATPMGPGPSGSAGPHSLPPWLFATFVIGHAALAVALLRRARRRAGRGRDEAEESEAARGRLRPRLAPDGREARE